VGRRAAGVHDALGDALVVEVRDLLTHDEVFQQGWPAIPGLEGVLVVGDLHALVGGQRLAGGIRAVGFKGIQLVVAVLSIGGVGTGQFAGPVGIVGHAGLSSCAAWVS